MCLSLRPHVWAFGGSIFRNSSVRPIGRRRARSPLRGLRTAAATGHRRRRRRPVELGCVVVGLAPHCRPAFGTDVVVLVAARQDEQELPPRRRGAATLSGRKDWSPRTGRSCRAGSYLRILHGDRTSIDASAQEMQTSVRPRHRRSVVSAISRPMRRPASRPSSLENWK